MAETWFTADTHFDHEFVARLRGYDPTERHDRAVVKEWNRIVGPNDTVWHLGDVGMGERERWSHWVWQLNGNIRLVTGNHDRVNPAINNVDYDLFQSWARMFDSIQQFATVKYRGELLLLSHFPYDGEGERGGPDRYEQARLRDLGMPLVHGHTHSKKKFSLSKEGTPMVHVGWDAWRRPVRLSEVWHVRKGADV